MATTSGTIEFGTDACSASSEPPRDPPDLEIQRLVESSFIHPLITEQSRIAAEAGHVRVEHNLMHNVATTEATSAIRVLATDASHYVAVVIPVLVDGLFMLLGRYRYAIGRWSIEFPRAQCQSEDAGWKRAAEQSLLRDTGLKARKMSLLGAIQPDTSLAAIPTIVILAEGCTARKRVPANPRDLIAGTIALAPAELDGMVLRGELSCGITLAALYLHGVRHPRAAMP